jgi:hypothetical protein
LHWPPQHSPAELHAAPSGAQPSRQTVRPRPSSPQKPVQHDAPFWQVSPSARHVPPRAHSRVSSLQTFEQQWSGPPERHSSPPGRHSGSRSTSQRPSWQLWEQQSESCWQRRSSLVVTQIAPPHTPS